METTNSAGQQTVESDFARMRAIRQQFGDYSCELGQFLSQGELENAKYSGALELKQQAQDLTQTGMHLKNGIFRLLVMGDVKRGKSTFINALLAENLLPADVTPCTAVLTILRFGREKTVTVHFRDSRPPQQLSFAGFRSTYTLSPEEAEKYEREQRKAFPDVSHAVVSYPLPLLEKGVEIVDSPGLNDTEELNELSLNYVSECQAVFFVLSAIQLFTHNERNYLKSFLTNRGRPTFFLINRWDQIAAQLLEPDPRELAAAEERIRQQGRKELKEYFTSPGAGRYEERVFEVSSLTALRRRSKNLQASLEGTGFDKFLPALTRFLEDERLAAEVRGVRMLANATYRDVHKKVERRVPLLSQEVEDLKGKIASVEPEFRRLMDIRQAYERDIVATGKAKASETANSLRQYIRALNTTFENDFREFQPEMKMLRFLTGSGREEFKRSLQDGFQTYLRHKMSSWTKLAEKELQISFRDLGLRGAKYGDQYSAIANTITEKLSGIRAAPGETPESAEEPTWSRVVAGAVAVLTGDFAGGAMAASGAFSWKSIMTNLAGVIGINVALYAIFGVVLGPLGVLLPALGLGALSAEMRRTQMIRHMREELEKQLPSIAESSWQTAHERVLEAFEAFRNLAVQSITKDIDDRRHELDNYIASKDAHEINRENESVRLRAFENNVLDRVHTIDREEGELSNKEQEAAHVTAAAGK